MEKKKIKKNLQKKKNRKRRIRSLYETLRNRDGVGKVVKYSEIVRWWWGHNKNPKANKKQWDKLSSLFSSSKTWDFIRTAESQFCCLFL